MRKNTARHWLHAGLDLLPLILIPVFMIYSHRHTIDNGSIDVPVNRVVDFNQQVKNGDFKTQEYWQNYTSLTTLTYNNGAVIVTIDNSSPNAYDYGLFQFNNINLYENHVYAFKAIIESNDFTSGFGLDSIGNFNDNCIYTRLSTDINYIWIKPITTNLTINVGMQYTVKSIYAIDITEMFGVGNEPTSQEFYNWYPNNYYDYTLSHKELLKGTSTITYDDTDIMSQFTYQLYNSVDKYFNMGNVFGMSNVYDWFNLNIFGGNASISIYIVWNIVLYEFVMDLLFLLYALFMWFIDVTKRLIEKPLDSIK